MWVLLSPLSLYFFYPSFIILFPESNSFLGFFVIEFFWMINIILLKVFFYVFVLLHDNCDYDWLVLLQAPAVTVTDVPPCNFTVNWAFWPVPEPKIGRASCRERV